jgi:plastocyanin
VFPRILFLLLVLIVPASGCGGDGDTGGAPGTTPTSSQAGRDADGDGGGTALVIIAGDIYLKPKEVEAPAGKITVTYTNDGQLQHTLLVEGKRGLYLDVTGRGDTDRGTIQLRPGSYTLYCDLPGHRPAGMEAKLTVR